MPSVLHKWVEGLPFMFQGTLLTSIRGNDVHNAPMLKLVVRWIRSLIVQPGNPENDFMEVDATLPSVEEFEDELEYIPIHYFLHLLHSLEIIGYKHPDKEVADIALGYYLRLVDWCHLAPEKEAEIDLRLSGKPGTTGQVKPFVFDDSGLRVEEEAPKPTKPRRRKAAPKQPQSTPPPPPLNPSYSSGRWSS